MPGKRAIARATMMSGVLSSLIAPLIAGLVLGLAYCAMLWFAVSQLPKMRRPVLWLIGTAIPRLGVPLLGLYWIMDGRWERLVAGLAGFVTVRLLIQQWVTSSRPGRGSTSQAREAE